MKKRILLIILIISLITISCNKFPDLGKKYRIDYTAYGNDIALLDSKNTYIVYGHITDYSFDSTFILVEQKPRDNFLAIIEKKDLKFNEGNELFEKWTFCQYWIIDKLNDGIYGPMNKVDYVHKKNGLGISKNLKLKFEKKKL